jgi:hypothetical protein
MLCPPYRTSRQESCRGVSGTSILVAWRTIGAPYGHETCLRAGMQSLPERDKSCKVVVRQVTHALVLPTDEQGPRAPRGNSDYIRTPRQLRCRQHPRPSSKAINRRQQSSPFAPDREAMAKQLSNSLVPWAYVCPPEHSTRSSSSGTRRMLAKLGELHQPLHPRPARNLGAAWGSTCLDRPCEQRSNVMLEITVLHRERLEVTLAQFGILWGNSVVSEGTIGNLQGLE